MIDWSIVKHGTRSHRGTHFADKSESNKTLWYIEANNLYGSAMMENLPYKDFEYSDTSLDEGETTLQRILNTPDDIDHGYCGTEIPDRRHKDSSIIINTVNSIYYYSINPLGHFFMLYLNPFGLKLTLSSFLLYAVNFLSFAVTPL